MMWRSMMILCFTLSASVEAAQPARLGPAEFYWLRDRACWYGDEVSVEMLLKAGADPSGLRDYEAFMSKYELGFEPSLHLTQAARGGHIAIVRMLLAAAANPNVPEGEGVTALTVAAEAGHLEVVKALLAAGADRNYRTPQGTAVELARRKGHTQVADLIRSYH
jgi:hypothetical protein